MSRVVNYVRERPILSAVVGVSLAVVAGLASLGETLIDGRFNSRKVEYEEGRFTLRGAFKPDFNFRKNVLTVSHGDKTLIFEDHQYKRNLSEGDESLPQFERLVIKGPDGTQRYSSFFEQRERENVRRSLPPGSETERAFSENWPIYRHTHDRVGKALRMMNARE